MFLLIATVLMVACEEATQEKDLLIGSWKLDVSATDQIYEEVVFTFHERGRLESRLVNEGISVTVEGEWRYDGDLLIIRYFEPAISDMNVLTLVVTLKTSTRLCWKTLRHPESEEDPEYDETCYDRV